MREGLSGLLVSGPVSFFSSLLQRLIPPVRPQFESWPCCLLWGLPTVSQPSPNFIYKSFSWGWNEGCALSRLATYLLLLTMAKNWSVGLGTQLRQWSSWGLGKCTGRHVTPRSACCLSDPPSPCVCLPSSELWVGTNGGGCLKWGLGFFSENLFLSERLKMVMMRLMEMKQLWLSGFHPGILEKNLGKWASRATWSNVYSGLNCHLSVSLKPGKFFIKTYLKKGSGPKLLMYWSFSSARALHLFMPSLPLWPWFKLRWQLILVKGFWSSWRLCHKSGPLWKGEARQLKGEFLAGRWRSC